MRTLQWRHLHLTGNFPEVRLVFSCMTHILKLNPVTFTWIHMDLHFHTGSMILTCRCSKLTRPSYERFQYSTALYRRQDRVCALRHQRMPGLTGGM